MVDVTRVFNDDGYPHLEWVVTVRDDELVFDANVSFGEEAGDGEFSLTLPKSVLRELLS